MVTNPVANAGDAKDTSSKKKRHEFDLWVGKIPRRRKWQPAPVFLPEKFHGQRSLAGSSLWGRKETDIVKRAYAHARAHTHTHTHTHTDFP